MRQSRGPSHLRAAYVFPIQWVIILAGKRPASTHIVLAANREQVRTLTLLVEGHVMLGAVVGHVQVVGLGRSLGGGGVDLMMLPNRGERQLEGR